MRINITEEERDYLLKVVGTEKKSLKKKLLNIKKRKSTTYGKCTKEQQENLKKIEEIVKNNYKIKNKLIYEKLKISKASFYKTYRKKTKELKIEYKNQALF